VIKADISPYENGDVAINDLLCLMEAVDNEAQGSSIYISK